MIGLALDIVDVIVLCGIDLDTSNWCFIPTWYSIDHTDIYAHEVCANWLIFGFTYFKYEFDAEESYE